MDVPKVLIVKSSTSIAIAFIVIKIEKKEYVNNFWKTKSAMKNGKGKRKRSNNVKNKKKKGKGRSKRKEKSN